MLKHIKQSSILGSTRGLSLLESVMAVALGAMIFIPLTMAFNVAIKTWDEHAVNDELYQHARVAMDRLTRELRHAIRLVDQEDPQELKFYTRRDTGTNPWVWEAVRYQKAQIPSTSLFGLSRNQNLDPPYFIAGSDGYPSVTVNSFSYVLYKVEEIEGQLQFQPLDTGDPISAADVVWVGLTLTNEDSTKSVILTSRVALRNK